ncbi:MAG: hypothetical protein ABH859_02935 [Pseudomonadota bacterium]
MLEKNANNRQRMLATLAVLEDGEKATDLLDFLNPEDKEICQAEIAAYLEIDIEERETKLQEQTSSLIASEQWSGLGEIHPAWVLEELKNEPPRIIGIILRYLPSRHVRYILEHLPPTIRYAIPNVVEAFYVPQPVLEVIKKLFESKFTTLRLSRSIKHLGFEHLYYLRSEELDIFFKDLGLQELALAFHDLPEKSLSFLLNRLPVKESNELKNRIKALSNVSEGLKRQSKFTVLEVEEKKVGADQFLLEIGLAAYARAVMPDQRNLMRQLEVKLAPQTSYLLKRNLVERTSKNTREISEERQTLIISRVASLAQENQIDQSWCNFFKADA